MNKDASDIIERATGIANQAQSISEEAAALANEAAQAFVQNSISLLGVGPTFLELFTIFVLACFIGYYVIWSVTPALHSPLMSVTNAISSVIIVGALIAAGPEGVGFSKIMGFIAIILASVNIFGGFIVTYRMLQMFKKKNTRV